MNLRRAKRRTGPAICACVALLLLALSGCSSLQVASPPQAAFYSLDDARMSAAAGPASAGPSPGTGRALIVNPPHAAAGFDSHRIIYVRTDHKLEYFAHNEWIDTPARMLAPLLVAALDRTRQFRAVVLTPSAAAADLRLDTEIVRLQQEFGGTASRVRLTLRAYLVDNATRAVLAWREFESIVPAASEDPYGGVVAANQAVRAALEELAEFCAATARAMPPSP